MMDPGELEAQLSGAVGRGEITAEFQAQIDVESGRIVAAETLARWHHPTWGTIAPDLFIPIAERTGAIDEIGDRMFRLACDAALDWQRGGYGIEVAVNVSAAQLRDLAFARRVLSTVTSLDLEPPIEGARAGRRRRRGCRR